MERHREWLGPSCHDHTPFCLGVQRTSTGQFPFGGFGIASCGPCIDTQYDPLAPQPCGEEPPGPGGFGCGSGSACVVTVDNSSAMMMTPTEFELVINLKTAKASAEFRGSAAQLWSLYSASVRPVLVWKMPRWCVDFIGKVLRTLGSIGIVLVFRARGAPSEFSQRFGCNSGAGDALQHARVCRVLTTSCRSTRKRVRGYQIA